MRKKIISCFCLVAFAVLMIGITASHSNTTLASEIEDNFTRMSNLSVDQMVSSNPYDYINCYSKATSNTYAIHHFYKSWLPTSVKINSVIKKVIAKFIGGERIAKLRNAISK